MDVVWLAVLTLLLGGWSVLDGFVLGLGMLLPRLGATPAERRLVLTGMGPFFLPNEVWLIAGAGVMTGAFPHFETDLFAGCWPVVVALLASWIARDAAVWFRSRRESDGWRTWWDRTLAVASLCFALAFGILIGNLVQGLPGPGERSFLHLINPFTLLCGLSVMLLFALHGAVFVALRVTHAPGERAQEIATALVRPTLLAVALTVVVGAVSGQVRAALDLPVPALVLAVLGLVAVALAGQVLVKRPGRAFALTAVGAGMPGLVALIGGASALLEGAGDAASLTLFARMGLPVLPVILIAQAWSWWLFRHRVGERSVVFF
ncbi:cytochrome d ubiquinol oxidase subunit II [Streptosporangium sp. CA-135522]|uniref:cytochrome d ubiquinol oxidase subunit II n=1 Tax=Streptosporangium sp. CA-135522 TaxID=3240072 RepID=UPI003D927A0F